MSTRDISIVLIICFLGLAISWAMAFISFRLVLVHPVVGFTAEKQDDDLGSISTEGWNW